MKGRKRFRVELKRQVVEELLSGIGIPLGYPPPVNLESGI